MLDYIVDMDRSPPDDVYLQHTEVMSMFKRKYTFRILFRARRQGYFIRSDLFPFNINGMMTNGYSSSICPFRWHDEDIAWNFHVNDVLDFNLLANPTVKKNGKRRQIEGLENQKNWLDRKIKSAGAELFYRKIKFSGVELLEPITAIQSHRSGKKGSHQIRMGAVEYIGKLIVKDTDRFIAAYEAGFGSGKRVGFGMMRCELER
jgi:CRISPR-associated protein Cas6/Cse3/CasE subtype I-E